MQAHLNNSPILPSPPLRICSFVVDGADRARLKEASEALRTHLLKEEFKGTITVFVTAHGAVVHTVGAHSVWWHVLIDPHPIQTDIKITVVVNKQDVPGALTADEVSAIEPIDHGLTGER